MEGELINEQETLDGELGYKGERGYSSYEIAVLNGFEGTEQDWLEHFGVDLTGYINTNDVIDNLTSTSTNYPLSAKQGKELKTLIDSKADDNTTYSKTEVDTELATKANSSDVYSKNDTDTLLATKLDASKIVIVETTYRTWTEGESININYPPGFNLENTFVLGVTAYSKMGSYVSGWSCPNIISRSSDTNSYLTGTYASVGLEENNMTLKSTVTGGSSTRKYVIALMKI